MSLTSQTDCASAALDTLRAIASQYDTPEVRAAIGALDHELHETRGYVKEITRRLNENEAGLGKAIGMSERTVYEYIQRYRTEHGPPTSEVDDVDAESVAAVKHRVVALMGREVAALERQKPGKMTRDQAIALRQMFANLDDMERREEAGAKRKGKGKAAAPEPEKPEGAIEGLARREREAKAQRQGEETPEPGRVAASQPHTDDRGDREGDEQRRESHGEAQDDRLQSGHSDGSEHSGAASSAGDGGEADDDGQRSDGESVKRRGHTDGGRGGPSYSNALESGDKPGTDRPGTPAT